MGMFFSLLLTLPIGFRTPTAMRRPSLDGERPTMVYRGRGAAVSVSLRYHVADIAAIDSQAGEDDRDDPHCPPDVAGTVRHRQVVVHDPCGTFPDHRRPWPAGQVAVRILLAGGDRVPGLVHRPADEVKLDG